MPSLSALNEFRNSFSNVANEREDLESKNLPYTALELPDKDAPVFEPPARVAALPSGIPSDFLDDMDDDSEAADTSATGVGLGGFDFGALLGAPSNDYSPPPPTIDDIFADTAPTDEVATEDETASTDDFLSSLGMDTPADDATTADDAASTDDFLSSLGMDTPADDTASADDATSTDDFLSSLGLDTPADDAAPADDTASTDDFLSSLGMDTPADDTTSADDFSVPTDLLSGLSDEIESAAPDFPVEETSLPAEAAIADDEDEEMSLGGERRDGSLSTDGVATDDIFEASAETAPEPAEEAPADFDLPDGLLSDTDTTPSADFDLPDDLMSDAPTPSADFDLPDNLVPDTDTSSADFDLPDNLVPDTDTPSADFDLPNDLMSDTPTPSADFDLPDGLLSDTDTTPSADFDLPDTDFSDTPVSDTKVSSDEEEGIELEGESQYPEEPIDLGGEIIEDAGGGDSFDDLPDTNFDMGESPSTGETDFDTSSSDGSGDESNDLLNMDDFGSDFASEEIELESGQSFEDDSGTPVSTVPFSDDDFNLPGLEDIFEKQKKETPKPPPKKSFFKRKKEEFVEEEPTLEDSDEIRLSQSDVDKLLASLATYPLNLRVACEELIAEQVILPQQLSKLIRMLVRGARVKEMAEFAGQILGKEIVIPRSYEKSTGAEWEAEKTSFAYIFVNNFLPILKIFAFAGVMLASTGFLCYKFIYIPIKAESLYRRGYERIGAGEFQRADELFHQAFMRHRKKKWFYAYAEGFRDQRRYLLAENKYDELLRYYPRDKKGVLDYAGLETYYLLNYEKANTLLQHELLFYAPNDIEGLLASGDNFMAWADSDPAKFYDKYEDARFAYARVLQLKGWIGQVLERMMLYFIRTDNLKETLNMRAWFENNRKKYKLSTPSLAELGGYLLDKQLEKVKGVPDAYVESIESVRDMLLQAVKEDNLLPEPHYHLARYYHNLGNVREERLTLENAIRAYNLAKSESVRRRLNRVDTHYRYANLLVNNKEFFPAEEQFVEGIKLYEDFVSRNLIAPTPQLGKLYAGLGDLEYFVKSGNIQAALNNYHTAERYGWSPPEIQYRMGAAYYQQERWGTALDYLFKAAAELPQNRRILFALGNATFKRGDYFAAQGYYTRLLDILENQRVRLPVLLPNDNPQFLELGERLMMARNNAGVVYEALAKQSGRREYRSRALALYADSARAWDSITRNPREMTRLTVGDTPGAPGINLGYLNANNALHPSPSFTPEIFIRIDKDVLEPSHWEELAPFGGLID